MPIRIEIYIYDRKPLEIKEILPKWKYYVTIKSISNSLNSIAICLMDWFLNIWALSWINKKTQIKKIYSQP